MSQVKTSWNLERTIPWLLIVIGIIGLVSSLVLTHDTLAINANAHYVPSCNLNPIVSCGSVISHKGDTIFGLPYPFYGVAAFAAVVTLGVGLMAKVSCVKTRDETKPIIPITINSHGSARSRFQLVFTWLIITTSATASYINSYNA